MIYLERDKIRYDLELEKEKLRDARERERDEKFMKIMEENLASTVRMVEKTQELMIQLIEKIGNNLSSKK